VTIKQKFSVSVRKTFVYRHTIQHLKVVFQNGKPSKITEVKISCLLNTRCQTSSNLSERVYNSNMHMFVAMDTQFIGAKLHKKYQTN